MQVFIYDVDFLEKGEPNFLAMRISSFHKQSGDTVTLLRPKDPMPRKADRIYVLQRDNKLKHPPVKMLMDKRVKVHGVKYFENWEPEAVLLACRPDYLLYPRGRNKYERSDAVQLTDEHRHLLRVKQDEVNVETNKDTVVTDEHLWNLPNDLLAEALKSIKNRKNIYFLYPIPLARLLADESITEAFLDLKFAKTVELQWINSFPFIEDKVLKVLYFFDRFKELHPQNKVGNISFYPKPASTFDADNIRLAIKLMCWMKERCWKIEIERLRNRLDTVYSHHYELMHNWSLQPHLSFFEFIAQTPAKWLGISIEDYYCHPELWTDEMFRAGIDLYHTVNHWVDLDHTFNSWRLKLPENWARWQYQDKWYSPTNINWAALLRRELWY